MVQACCHGLSSDAHVYGYDSCREVQVIGAFGKDGAL